MKKLLFTLVIFCLALTAFAQDGGKSGKWTKKSYNINGSWNISKSGETFTLVLDDEFKTKSAPDLKIFLSKKEIESLNSDNATKDAVLVSALRKSSGRQEYVIKESIDLSAYKTILIHCEEYSVLWGVSNLSN